MNRREQEELEERERMPVAEVLPIFLSRFYGALNELGWDLSPDEIGTLGGTMAAFMNEAKEIPSKKAIKVLLPLMVEELGWPQ